MHVSIDNRRATRFLEPGGRALCRAGSTTLRYQIQDTSTSGIALSGPGLQLGTPVALRLWWPMIGSANASGVVCRNDPSSHKVSVKYTHDEGIGDLLRDLSAIAIMRQTEPTALFCGNNHAIHQAMEHLDEAGFEYEHATTPLEAFCLVQDPWRPFTTLACAPTPLWLEFAEVMETENPQLRRVLLADENTSGAHERAVENGTVHNILCEPWHPYGLYEALGLKLSQEPCLCCGARIAPAAVVFCAQCSSRSTQLCELDDLGEGD